MIQTVLRSLVSVAALPALSALLVATISPSTVSADLCQDYFDSRPVRTLGQNEFGVLYFNNGAGRNFLGVGHLMGSITEKGVTYLTLTSDHGGLRHFDSTMVFTGIDPVRARAMVISPNKGLAVLETRIVTLVGMRKIGDREEYIARTGDGQLLLVWLHEVLE